MTAARLQHRQRGVSLVEALVALAVMAFGILGVVGIQATLRSNADTSRQRGEAVRIAQRAVEDARSFDKLTGPAPSYTAIQSTVSQPIADPDATHLYSTAFNRQSTVAQLVLPASAAAGTELPKGKVLAVVVSWADRASQPQQVRIVSNIAGVAPELAGSLGLSGDGSAGVRQPYGRNRSIPRSAVVDAGGTTSTFTPPGGAGVTWVFNNLTGVITSICITSVCTPANAYLLSGYIRFALGGDPVAQSANPSTPVPSPPFAVDVVVDKTVPSTATSPCFEQTFAGYVAYYCAVTYATTAPFVWSGKSKLVLTGGVVAAALGSASTTEYKVCRYTPGRSEDNNGDGRADGDFPLRGNIDHPLTYANVDGALTNQNFLVISAGDGATPFDCPPAVSGYPVNTNTWRHQPPVS